MDVTSLFTNIPQEEEITTICKTYEYFYKNNLPTPTNFLREMLCLILKENSFQFNRQQYLQTHGTTMGTKMAVAFANIFMASTCHTSQWLWRERNGAKIAILCMLISGCSPAKELGTKANQKISGYNRIRVDG